MELSLELMAIVCLYRMNAKGKTAGEIIYKVYSAGLVMLIVYLQRPGPCGIIYGRVLIRLYDTACFVLKGEKLNINLNPVTWHLLS